MKKKYLVYLLIVMITGCVTVEQQIISTPTATANVRELSRITNDESLEQSPKASPDGKKIVYTTLDTSKYAGEAYSIVGINLDHAGKNLVAGPYAMDPAWMNDGDSIVYTYLKAAKPILVKQPYAGMGMTFITPSSMGGFDGQPDISPNGDRIAFHTQMGSGFVICTVNIDGSEFTVYTEGTSPRWHPTDNMLVFDKSDGTNVHIFTLNLDSGQVTQLTSGQHHNAFPVWSPDGKWIAFVSDRDGKYHLYAMKSTGANLTQLTQGETQEHWPDWASTGYLYFISNAGYETTPSNDWAHTDIWRIFPVLQ